MNAHVTEWLAAYYDGELPENRRRQVEEHLSSCASCRAELEELYKLSRLLQEAPAPERLTSAQRFQAQVNLRLPPAIPQTGWMSALKAGWRLAPLGAVFLWAFAQVVLLLTGVVSILELPVGATLASLSGGSSLSGFSISLGGVGEVLELGLLNLAFTAMVALFLCGWIASWWVLRRQAQTVGNNYPSLLGE